MSIWVRSFYLDFEKLRLHWATPFSVAQSRRTCFHHFVLCTNFSLFHISRLDMFLQTQNTTMKTKNKNKVTMLSFYSAKLKKVKSLNIRKEMVKNVIFVKLWDMAKCV